MNVHADLLMQIGLTNISFFLARYFVEQGFTTQAAIREEFRKAEYRAVPKPLIINIEGAIRDHEQGFFDLLTDLPARLVRTDKEADSAEAESDTDQRAG